MNTGSVHEQKTHTLALKIKFAKHTRETHKNEKKKHHEGNDVLIFFTHSDACVYAAQGVQQPRRCKYLEKKKQNKKNVTLDVQYV